MRQVRKSRKVKVVVLLVFITLLFVHPVYADAGGTDLYSAPTKIRCTCYHYTGSRCANGNYPLQGLSVAGKREWIGKVCAIYQTGEDGCMGDFIGYFEFTDTGGSYIRSGERIDVYRDTLEGCNEWVAEYGDYVYFQIIEAEG